MRSYMIYVAAMACSWVGGTNLPQWGNMWRLWQMWIDDHILKRLPFHGDVSLDVLCKDIEEVGNMYILEMLELATLCNDVWWCFWERQPFKVGDYVMTMNWGVVFFIHWLLFVFYFLYHIIHSLNFSHECYHSTF